MKGPTVRVRFFEQGYTVYWNEDTGKVRVSSSSFVKKGADLKSHVNPDGYLEIKMAGKSQTIHSLVAAIALGRKPKGYTVNHKDGNKLNNSKGNLEYLTVSENVRHAIANGLHVSSHPERHGHYKDGRSTKANRKQYQHDWYLNNKKHGK